MAAQYPDLELWAAGFSFGSYIAMTGGADDDRVCALIGIAPPVDRYEFASVKLSTKPKFIIHGERDELIPLKAVRAVLRAAPGAEGAGRDRPRQPPVRRPGQRSRRRARRSAGGFLMHDAVIVAADAHRRRQGAERRAANRPARRDGRGRHRRSRCAARPASIRATIDDVILGCAMPEAEQGLNVARIASLRAGVPVERVGRDGQPLLLVGPAGDRLRRRAHHVRLRRRRRSPAAPSR